MRDLTKLLQFLELLVALEIWINFNMHYTSQQDDWLVQLFQRPALVEETDNKILLDNQNDLCNNNYYIIKHRHKYPICPQNKEKEIKKT